MNILNIEHIHKIFGDKVIFDDISCGIDQGEKIGIIGVNGTGKTTLLRVIAGEEEPDEGQVITQNGIRISWLPQTPEFPQHMTISPSRWLVGSSRIRMSAGFKSILASATLFFSPPERLSILIF